MTATEITTPRPPVYLAEYEATNGLYVANGVTFKTAEELAADPEVRKVLAHRTVAEALEAGDWNAHVQVAIFATLAEAGAFIYGYSMAADWDDCGWLTQQMDGYAIGLVFNDDVDEGDLKYVDRRKNETWDSVPGLWS